MMPTMGRCCNADMPYLAKESCADVIPYTLKCLVFVIIYSLRPAPKQLHHCSLFWHHQEWSALTIMDLLQFKVIRLFLSAAS